MLEHAFRIDPRQGSVDSSHAAIEDTKDESIPILQKNSLLTAVNEVNESNSTIAPK